MSDKPRATNGRHRRRVSPIPLFAGATAVVLFGVVGAYLLAEGGSVPLPGDQDTQTATFESALDAYDAGEYADSEAALAELVTEDPGDLEARKALAQALAAQGKNDEALEQYAAIVVEDPEDHESLYAMAVLERLLGDSVNAIKHLEAAVDVTPEMAYLDDLALTYVQVGRYRDAVDCWEQVLATEQLDEVDQAELYAAMATAYEGMRDYNGARAALEHALALSPNDENLKARLQSMAG